MRGFIFWLTAATLLMTGCSTGADTKLAEQEVAHFHQLYDAGRYADIYAATGPQVRRDMGQAEFLTFLAELQGRVGNVAKAESSGWKADYGTGGNMVTLTYNTVFSHGRGEETFVYAVSGGKATLAGYYIKYK